MSVRVGDRDEGKLRAIEAMRKLMVYTHDRVKSDNFPKSERWITAKQIWDACADAHANILKANGIRVENQLDAQERLLAEKIAIGRLDYMIALIDICNQIGMVSNDQAEYWTGLATNAQNMAKAWLKSQRTMYKSYLGN